MFEKIKKFYGMGLYTDAQVRKFVDKGVITEEQYSTIVVDENGMALASETYNV